MMTSKHTFNKAYFDRAYSNYARQNPERKLNHYSDVISSYADGFVGKTILDAKGVKALAELPSLDELRAKIIGLLNAPATKIARTVKEPGAKLARVIQAKAAKGEAA